MGHSSAKSKLQFEVLYRFLLRCFIRPLPYNTQKTPFCFLGILSLIDQVTMGLVGVSIARNIDFRVTRPPFPSWVILGTLYNLLKP